MVFDQALLDPADPRPIPHSYMKLWLRTHNMTQRDLAHRLDREESMVGKVLRGRSQSEPIWREIKRLMQDPEKYRPLTSAQREKAVRLARAEKLVQRATLASRPA